MELIDIKNRMKEYIRVTEPPYSDKDGGEMCWSDKEPLFDIHSIVETDENDRTAITFRANNLIDKFDEERAVRWIQVFAENVLNSAYSVHEKKIRDNGADYDMEYSVTLFNS